MKRLILLLILCPIITLAQSHEILRPTTDDNSAGAATVTATCNNGTAQTGVHMTGSYDAAGLSTSTSMSAHGTTSITVDKGDTLLTWQAVTQTYTALTLNINSTGSTSGVGGQWDAAYTLNGGSTWIDFGVGSPQKTYTVSLNPTQDMTKVEVNMCVEGLTDPSTPGTGTIQTWDVWSDGTYTPAGGTTPGAPNFIPVIQPVISSDVFFSPSFRDLWAFLKRELGL